MSARRPAPRPLVRRAPMLGVAALAATLAATVVQGPAVADDSDLPPGRTPTPYVVRPGDTATALAVRHRAWTAELIAVNHLGPDGHLRVGQRIVIPVVTALAGKPRGEGNGNGNGKKNSGKKGSRAGNDHWQHSDPSRQGVRRVIARTARQLDVDPQLALAVSWQEAGWQMHHVSSANAIGAMQVLPPTARWMELYTGRPLRLHRLRDNALAGVMLLRVLDAHTSSRRHQVAAYYQGLGAVRRHGLYDDTRAYVANVLAIKRRLEAGRPPA